MKIKAWCIHSMDTVSRYRLLKKFADHIAEYNSYFFRFLQIKINAWNDMNLFSFKAQTIPNPCFKYFVKSFPMLVIPVRMWSILSEFRIWSCEVWGNYISYYNALNPTTRFTVFHNVLTAFILSLQHSESNNGSLNLLSSWFLLHFYLSYHCSRMWQDAFSFRYLSDCLRQLSVSSPPVYHLERLSEGFVGKA
jgi:hypothetical protein